MVGMWCALGPFTSPLSSGRTCKHVSSHVHAHVPVSWLCCTVMSLGVCVSLSVCVSSTHTYTHHRPQANKRRLPTQETTVSQLIGRGMLLVPLQLNDLEAGTLYLLGPRGGAPFDRAQFETHRFSGTVGDDGPEFRRPDRYVGEA